MENSISLGTIQVPDELAVDQWCSRGHHAVDPLGIIERLVDERRTVVPLTVHVEVITALERDGANGANFVIAGSNGQADLTGHRGTTDDGFLHAEFLEEGGDEADVAVFGVGVLACEWILECGT